MQGFTLFELLIVLLIISILASFAIPLYTAQINKTQRLDGKAAILGLASAMEHYFMENQTYATATINKNGATDVLGNSNSSQHYYELQILAQTKNSFVISAIPTIQDETCGSLQLNQLGERTITGSGTIDECW